MRVPAAGSIVPADRRRRTGESSARRRTALLKKNPPLATGRSLGRNGKVSRFAAALCVTIHTRRGKPLGVHRHMRLPYSEIGPPGVEASRRLGPN